MRQHTVTRSITEAEYRALAHTIAEIMWLQQLLADLHVSLDGILVVFCDNLSAIVLTSNPIFHARTKYIEVDYHFIHEQVLAKHICIQYVSSEAQIVADVFIEPLTVSKFQQLSSKLLVKSIPLSLRWAISKAH